MTTSITWVIEPEAATVNNRMAILDFITGLWSEDTRGDAASVSIDVDAIIPYYDGTTRSLWGQSNNGNLYQLGVPTLAKDAYQHTALPAAAEDWHIPVAVESAEFEEGDALQYATAHSMYFECDGLIRQIGLANNWTQTAVNQATLPWNVTAEINPYAGGTIPIDQCTLVRFDTETAWRAVTACSFGAGVTTIAFDTTAPLGNLGVGTHTA